MEDFAIITSMLALAWGIVVTIVTFKVWGACNGIVDIRRQLNAVLAENRAAATAIHAELQNANQARNRQP